MKHNQYWNTQWNPVEGCTPVSEGCARTLPERLAQPLHWRKPRVVFVCTSDLFHPAVPFDFIEEVFTTMLISSLHDTRHGHTFLVLTKRPDRMLEAVRSMSADRMAVLAGRRMEDSDGWHDVVWKHVHDHGPAHDKIWPGVTVENQERANERIPLLFQTPAAHRWLSCELLGGIDLSKWLDDPCDCGIPPLEGAGQHSPACRTFRQPWGIDQVIVSGESGPRARPYDLDWPRSIIGQCKDAGVPCFHKQVGSMAHDARSMRWVDHGIEERLISSDARHVASVWSTGCWHTWDRQGIGGENWTEATPGEAKSAAERSVIHQGFAPLKLRSRSGNDPSEWPEDLRVRELAWMKR